MCNAWNHPPECRCGWGGEGHAGKRQVGSDYNQWVPPLDLSRESFTCPNACCPVCGALVFFYKSPDGGRVFFDELGPPWPKHPCTNSTSIPAKLSVARLSLHEDRSAWEDQGWRPVQLRYDSEIDKFFSRLNLISGGVETNLYLRKSSLTRYGKKVSIQAHLPAHIREIREDVFELSMLDRFARPVLMSCFANLALARDREPTPVRKPGRKRVKQLPPAPRTQKFTLKRKRRSGSRRG